ELGAGGFGQRAGAFRVLVRDGEEVHRGMAGRHVGAERSNPAGTDDGDTNLPALRHGGEDTLTGSADFGAELRVQGAERVDHGIDGARASLEHRSRVDRGPLEPHLLKLAHARGDAVVLGIEPLPSASLGGVATMLWRPIVAGSRPAASAWRRI